MLPSIAIVGCLYALFSFAVFVLVVNQSVQRWEEIRPHWWRFFLFGLGLFALSIPSLASTVSHADKLPVPSGAEATPSGARGAFVFLTFGIALLGIGYTPLQMGVASLARERAAFPWLVGGEQPRNGLGLAALVGVVAGSFSLLASGFVEMGSSELMKAGLDTFLGGGWRSAWVTTGGWLCTLVAYATSEEILFRGLVQKWLERWLGATRVAALLAVGLASLLWGMAHFANTTSPWLKLAQTFPVGLAFGWFARRYCVEASIAAHVAMNVTLLVCGVGQAFIGALIRHA